DVQSLQFGQQGADADIGAHVIDVTSLPDTLGIKDKGFIRAADAPGGFHNIYAYKHSDGRVLLFTTVQGQHANVYDMEKFLAGDAKFGLVGQVPVPETPNQRMRATTTSTSATTPPTIETCSTAPGQAGTMCTTSRGW